MYTIGMGFSIELSLEINSEIRSKVCCHESGPIISALGYQEIDRFRRHPDNLRETPERRYTARRTVSPYGNHAAPPQLSS